MEGVKKGVNPGPWRARLARLVVDREIPGSVLSSVLAKLSAKRFAKANFFGGLALAVALTATFLKAIRLGGWASAQGNGDAPFFVGSDLPAEISMGPRTAASVWGRKQWRSVICRPES